MTPCADPANEDSHEGKPYARLRRDHLVPRFYLEGFTSRHTGRRRSCLCVFDKVRGTAYTRTPEQVWREPNYYDVRGRDGTSLDVLDRINREVEATTAPVFKADGFLARRAMPSAEERECTAAFAGMLDVRSPNLHDLAAEAWEATARNGLLIARHHCKNDPEAFERAVRSLERQTGVRISGATLEDVSSARIDPGMDTIKASFFEVMPIPRTLIARMPWTLLVAQGDDVFITSDRPLARENMAPGPQGFVMGELNAFGFHYLLPLTQKVALATHLEPGGVDRGFVDASTYLVTLINAETWARAPRYRYAPRRDFTGHDVISKLERRAAFVAEQLASLSGPVRGIAEAVLSMFPPTSAEEREQIGRELYEDIGLLHSREEVLQVVDLLDRLIAARTQLSPSWELPMRSYRDQLFEIAKLRPRVES